jgi:3-deoxy-7-phosphoheptulonate synthase
VSVLLREARARTGLPVVTELTDVRELDAVLRVADVIQAGARNMHNYTLLTELGRAGRPVLLKRGPASSLDDLLLAAEYILVEGNDDVFLCERGIRSFETAYRYTLDLAAVPVLKERTSLPGDRRSEPRRGTPRARPSPESRRDRCGCGRPDRGSAPAAGGGRV